MPSNLFGKLPTVSELLERPPLKKLRETMGSTALVSSVGAYLDRYQRDFKTRVADFPAPKLQQLAESISRWLASDAPPGIQAAINGTGIMLATELGKCALAERAIQGAYARLRDYHTTQLCSASPESRGVRSGASQAEAARLIAELAGAPDAAIVNTRESALHLALNQLAAGRKLVVARGHLGETFDAIHLPRLIAGAGARLAEVGASNSASLADFEKAIDDETAAILVVDDSNFGGASRSTTPSLSELVALAKSRRVSLIYDIGLGGLQNRDEYRGLDVRNVKDAVGAGADLVIAAGNHLLGGPEAGLLVGQRSSIEALRQSPLFPLTAPAPLSLAVLAETLEIYRVGDFVADEIPLLSLLTTSQENLELRANRLAEQIVASPLIESASVEPCKSQLVPGGAPIDSFCVAIAPSDGDPQSIRAQLRENLYPLYVREKAERIEIDLRGIFPRQDFMVAAMFPLGLEEPSQ
ncbi:MAG: aminotransferase class V-fold PLP-dependent enzyme [Blastopirellula sp. JB062]